MVVLVVLIIMAIEAGKRKSNELKNQRETIVIGIISLLNHIDGIVNPDGMSVGTDGIKR